MNDDDVIKAGGNDLDGADFDDVGGLDDEFGDPVSGQTLGDLVRNSPLVKLGIIVGAIFLVVGIIILFGGSKEQTRSSAVSRASEVSAAPGQDDVSPAYEEAVREFNTAELERALRQNESTLPVPVGTARGRVGLQEDQAQAEDPLDRWRRIQEERQKRTQQERPSLPSGDPNAQAVDALTKLMQTQMESILSTKRMPPVNQMGISTDGWLEEQFEAAEARRRAALEQTQATLTADGDVAEIIIPAGTIEYAQLLIEANSDAPGPVLAQVVSGPLAGSRMLGSFSVEDDFLVLSFNQIVVDGVSLRTDAVALDPKTTGVGVVTDIDRRYFKRVILPAAAEFIEGMAGAIADTGSTVVVIGDTALQQQRELNTREQLYTGMEEAAGVVSDILTADARRTRPMVKVRAGTPIGIMFVAPVVEGAKRS